jgi:hypothetical protein
MLSFMNGTRTQKTARLGTTGSTSDSNEKNIILSLLLILRSVPKVGNLRLSFHHLLSSASNYIPLALRPMAT